MCFPFGSLFIHPATSLSKAGSVVGSSEVPPRPQGAVGAGVSEPHEEAPGAFTRGPETPHCG